MGGLVSSTAVTLSFSERSQEEPHLARPFALAITLAWTVMFGRVVVEVAVLNHALLSQLWLPMVTAAGAGLAFCIYYYFAHRTHQEGDVKLSNPFELGPAIKFGILYAVILIVAKAAQYYFQTAGLYAAAAVAGLADVDAITLSMAELAGSPGGVEVSVAARAVILAVMSNTIVKGVIALGNGSKSLRKALLPPFALILMSGGIAVLLLVSVSHNMFLALFRQWWYNSGGGARCCMSDNHRMKSEKNSSAWFVKRLDESANEPR